MTLLYKALAVLMSFLLVFTAIPVDATAQTNQQSASAPASQADEYALLTADELDGLVAPIALYPDALVAQVLGAATFPYEIVDAVVWMKQNSSLTGEALAKAVDQQSWDPVVKALTQFPTVLDNLAKNLAWTSSLGEASATQQQDVMAAIQRMRGKAQAAGNLKSSPEIKLVQESPQTIVIQPANPQVVYVPTYNPTVIYGAPVVVPGYSSADVAAAAIISFGVGIAVGAAVYGGCCGWGWGYWGTSWHSHTIIYNRNVYVGNPYWRGGYYGGYPGYRPPGYPGYRPPGYPGYRPGYPGYRPPGGYPGYGRPPATTLPAPANPGNRPGNGGSRPPSTLPANPGNRPGNNPGTRPGGGGAPSTQPVNPGTRPGNNPGTRPGGGTPSTQPANPGNRAGQTPSTRPSTNDARGYQRPQTSNAPSTQAARPNALSGSGGGRAQSARGSQSMGGGSRGGGRSN
jgi:uncharacterized membrane protein YgcG